MKEKIENDDPNYFYKNTGFLDLILGIIHPKHHNDDTIEEL